MELLRVAIDKIDPNPYQTRFALDENEIAALAEDIQRNGLLQPPTGRIIDAGGKLLDGNIYFHKDYRVQLAFGHRRLAAYKLLAADHSEFLSMPLFYRLFDDETMAILAWSENEKREQLNPVERATAIIRFQTNFGWSQEQVGEKIGMDRSTVANLVRMMRLPQAVLRNLEAEVISQRQAMALLPFYDLQDADRDYLMNKPDFEEFLVLARNGQLSSDTIRERLQREANNLPQKKQANLFTERPERREENETLARQYFDAVEEMVEDRKEAEQQLEPEQDVCTQTPAETGGPLPWAEPETRQAPQPEPPPAEEPKPAQQAEPQQSAPVTLDVLKVNQPLSCTITWLENAITIGMRRGSGIPCLRFFDNLEDEQIPEIIQDLRDEIGG